MKIADIFISFLFAWFISASASAVAAGLPSAVPDKTVTAIGTGKNNGDQSSRLVTLSFKMNNAHGAMLINGSIVTFDGEPAPFSITRETAYVSKVERRQDQTYLDTDKIVDSFMMTATPTITKNGMIAIHLRVIKSSSSRPDGVSHDFMIDQNFIAKNREETKIFIGPIANSGPRKGEPEFVFKITATIMADAQITE